MAHEVVVQPEPDRGDHVGTDLGELDPLVVVVTEQPVELLHGDGIALLVVDVHHLRHHQASSRPVQKHA